MSIQIHLSITFKILWLHLKIIYIKTYSNYCSNNKFEIYRVTFYACSPYFCAYIIITYTYIQIMIFRFFGYTWRPYFWILEIFCSTIKDVPLSIQTSGFQIGAHFFTFNYSTDIFLKILMYLKQNFNE